MTTILILTGSARPNSAGTEVTAVVTAQVAAAGATAQVVHAADLALPFFNAPYSPISPEYTPPNEHIANWAKQVAAADGVILIMPEYNAAMTAVQKNAVDWVGKEWSDKPVAFVAYGWHHGVRVIANAEAVFHNLHAAIQQTYTTLQFGETLRPDGVITDNEAVEKQIKATVQELIQAIGMLQH